MHPDRSIQENHCGLFLPFPSISESKTYLWQKSFFCKAVDFFLILSSRRSDHINDIEPVHRLSFSFQRFISPSMPHCIFILVNVKKSSRSFSDQLLVGIALFMKALQAEASHESSSIPLWNRYPGQKLHDLLLNTIEIILFSDDHCTDRNNVYSCFAFYSTHDRLTV